MQLVDLPFPYSFLGQIYNRHLEQPFLLFRYLYLSLAKDRGNLEDLWEHEVTLDESDFEFRNCQRLEIADVLESSLASYPFLEVQQVAFFRGVWRSLFVAIDGVLSCSRVESFDGMNRFYRAVDLVIDHVSPLPLSLDCA